MIRATINQLRYTPTIILICTLPAGRTNSDIHAGFHCVNGFLTYVPPSFGSAAAMEQLHCSGDVLRIVLAFLVGGSRRLPTGNHPSPPFHLLLTFHYYFSSITQTGYGMLELNALVGRLIWSPIFSSLFIFAPAMVG